MAIVNYNGKTVSDDNLKLVLARIAARIGSVRVTSGDRNFVPQGGSNKSLHLANRAVDFYIPGISLQSAYNKLLQNMTFIFDLHHKYEVIFHGSFTNTGGAHLHIGRYDSGSGVTFKMEGTTPESRGKYSILV